MKGNILNFTAESAVHAFRFAKIGTAEGKVKEATAGSVVFGATTDIDSEAGHPCDVQMDGIARVECGGTVSAGDKVAPDANGKAVKATGNSCAVAIESGVSGDIIRVKLVESAVNTSMEYTAEEAVDANLFVKAGTATGKVKVGTAGATVIGVAPEAIAANAKGNIEVAGVVKVKAGDSISMGALLVSDANGKAVAVTSGNSFAIALEGGASGDVIAVKLQSAYTPGT